MSTTIVPLGSSAIFVDGGKLRYINAKTGIGLICSNVSGTPLEVKPDRLVYVDDSKVEVVTKPLFLLEAFVAGERAKRGALLETRILAMNPAKWLQTATSTTKLTHSILFNSFCSCFNKNAPRLVSLRSVQRALMSGSQLKWSRA